MRKILTGEQGAGRGSPRGADTWGRAGASSFPFPMICKQAKISAAATAVGSKSRRKIKKKQKTFLLVAGGQ